MSTFVLKTRFHQWAVIIALTLASLPMSLGQANASRGEILGTVRDSSNALIPGATVTVNNTQTGLEREVTSDDAGRFRFLRLDPGTYALTAEAPNFASSRLENIVLTVGSSVNADITLQVQETVTSIDVVASLLAVSEPAPSTNIPDTAITNLPINGRRFQDFATLTPTVQVESQRGTLSFAGQRGVNGNVMLEGGDYNNPFFGGIRGGERANLVPTVPQSAIQEFTVNTTGYNAEYGRSTGGTLNVITKSGTNDFHGNAFWQMRDGEFSLPDPLFDATTGETQYQFGGAAGGPIVADRAFFFGAIERQDAEAPRGVRFARLTPLSPTADTQEAFSFYQNQEEPFQLTNDATALTGRFDYNMSEGDQLTFRYNFSDAEGQNAVNTGNSLNPFTNRSLSNDGVEKDRTHTGSTSYTKILTPTILNDFRFGATYELRPRLSNSNTPELGNLIGTTGGRSFLPTTEDDIRVQIGDALTWTRGGHSIKLGFDYNFINAAQTFGFGQFGDFDINGNNEDTIMEIMSVGGPTANRFDSTAVTYTRQIGNLTADMDMHQTAIFAQDSWRVNSQLTLDFGFRWEGQYNPEPEATNQELVNLVRNVRSPLGTILDPTAIPNDTMQFMPRFGFAWSPNTGSRRTVVRGHTGLFHASTPLLLFADASNNFRATPGNLSVFMGPANGMTVYDQFLSVGVDLNDYSLDALPVLSIDQALQAVANGLGQDPTPFAGASVQMIAPDFKNPRSFQLGFGVEHEITSNLIASVQGNYVNTVRLQRNRDHNIALAPRLDATLRPVYGLRSGTSRPIPELSSITLRESTARSMYRGVTLKLERRAASLTFGVNYTWSETFSDDDNERSSSGTNGQDQFNLRPDYNYSVLDARHQFTSYAVYQLPYGFEVTGSFGVRSGRPLNATAGTDANQDFSNFSDRPYSAPGVTVPRFSFRDRTVVTANNLRVMKSFFFGESMRVQLSAEMFNLFNVDNVVLGSSFGDDTYGVGIDPATGNVVAPRADFMRLRMPDGSYDTTNRQDGAPFQAQFGARFFF